MINPDLKKGDRVMLLHMEGSGGLMPGTWGTVRNEVTVMGVKQYSVIWDDGTKETPGKQISSLNLLSDVDMWTLEGFKKKKVSETVVFTKKQFLKETEKIEKDFKRRFLRKLY